MRWPHFPVVYLLTTLLVGYLLHWGIGFNPLLAGVLLGGSLLFGLLGVWVKKQYGRFYTLGVYLFLILCFYGLRAAYYWLPKNHFTKSNLENTIGPLSGVLIEKLSSTNARNRYYAQLLQQGDQPIEGKIVVQFMSKNPIENLRIGRAFATNKIPSPIDPPKHPGQFDYKNYLANQRIFGELKLFEGDYTIVETDPPISLKMKIELWRQKSLKRLSDSSLSMASKGLLGALIFGEQSGIEMGQMQAYAKAGVIHILVISGLHIGLITFFLLFILRPLNRLDRVKYVSAFLVILLLWFYAFFTGLKPSVIRAVCMFSLWALATQGNFRQDPLNVVLCSAFILLVCYPPYLFSVGFQMSYLAVLGILSGHPILSRLWQPRWRPVRYLWQLTVVTLSAQIAVTPLSIFYFKQFPGLFLISNWMILPFFGGLLGLSFIITGANLISLKILGMNEIYDWIVHTFNRCINAIAAQENLIFTDLKLNLGAVLLLYFFLFLLLQRRRKIAQFPWVYLLSALLIVQGGFVLVQHFLIPKKTLWMVSHYQTTALAYPENNKLKMLVAHQEVNLDKIASFYTQYFYTDSLAYQSLPNFIIKEHLRILVCKNASIMSVEDFDPTHLLVTGNPKINFDRLLEKIKPQKVIFGGDIRPWRLVLWEASCKKQKIPYHNLAKEGSLKISL